MTASSSSSDRRRKKSGGKGSRQEGGGTGGCGGSILTLSSHTTLPVVEEEDRSRVVGKSSSLLRERPMGDKQGSSSSSEATVAVAFSSSRGTTTNSNNNSKSNSTIHNKQSPRGGASSVVRGIEIDESIRSLTDPSVISLDDRSTTTTSKTNATTITTTTTLHKEEEDNNNDDEYDAAAALLLVKHRLCPPQSSSSSLSNLPNCESSLEPPRLGGGDGGESRRPLLGGPSSSSKKKKIVDDKDDHDLLHPSEDEWTKATTQRQREDLKTWYSTLRELREYRRINGHCHVPQNFGPLGHWCNKQRSEKRYWDHGKVTQMTERKMQALEHVGFEWAKPKGEASWMAHYEELVEFRKVYGHCNAPTRVLDSGPECGGGGGGSTIQAKYAALLPLDRLKALGRWITEQRTQKSRRDAGKPSSLTDDRFRLLDELGFCWGRFQKPRRRRMINPQTCPRKPIPTTGIDK